MRLVTIAIQMRAWICLDIFSLICIIVFWNFEFQFLKTKIKWGQVIINFRVRDYTFFLFVYICVFGIHMPVVSHFPLNWKSPLIL